MKKRILIIVLNILLVLPSVWAQEEKKPSLEEIEEMEWKTMSSEKVPPKKKKPVKKKTDKIKEETKKEAVPEVQEKGPPKVVNEPIPMPIPSAPKGPAPEEPVVQEKIEEKPAEGALPAPITDAVE